MTDSRRLAALRLLPVSALFIVPGISAAQQHEPTAEHPAYATQRNESTVLKDALFVRLEAKPGKEKELAQFLQAGLDLARQESTTPVWFALQLGPSTFGIFDAFTDEAGRQAHLNGPIAQALGANAPNLPAQAPSIERSDVSDVERSKQFYERLGWRLDQDVAPVKGVRIVQFTPPGSACSVTFGKGITGAAPGSAAGGLIVCDIEAAHDEFVRRGIDASGMWPGPPFPPEARLSRPDPKRTSYGSFFSFKDPDGNTWLVQDVTTRLPGRV